jgi:hypothetical protein
VDREHRPVGSLVEADNGAHDPEILIDKPSHEAADERPVSRACLADHRTSQASLTVMLPGADDVSAIDVNNLDEMALGGTGLRVPVESDRIEPGSVGVADIDLGKGSKSSLEGVLKFVA